MEIEMNVALWIAAGLLALAMLAAGATKILQPKEQLKARMGWVDDFSAGQVKAIGVLEVLAGIGLILPPLLDIAPILAPIAAAGVAVIMVGAIVVHTRRKEYQGLPINVILLLLAVFVAWGRFGPHPF
jgi:uncharacterized membrane protein YphA (DoxX/SURF4 family)